MGLDFNKICRLCMLEEEKLMPLFSRDECLPQRVMALVPSLKLCDGDGLPAQVCSRCLHQVNASYNFKLQCESTDIMLQQILTQEVQSKNRKYCSDKEIAVKKEIEGTELNKNSILLQCSFDDQGFSESDKHMHLQFSGSCMTNENYEESNWQNCNGSNGTEVIVPEEKCVRQKKFVCHICGKSFQFKKGLLRHMVIHTGERAFVCDVCGKKFSLKNNLKTHSRVHSGEKPYSCEDCGTGFRQLNALSNHMKIHTGQRPFSCVDCGKRFALAAHLQAHLVCHTGEKAFSCSICLKSFGRKDGLKQHMQIHIGQRPFLCTICGKSFVQKSQLKTHTVAHTHNKPYLCPKCGRTFVNSTRLRDHVTSHTGKRPFVCEECEKGFVRREHLRYHLKAIHRKLPIK